MSETHDERIERLVDERQAAWRAGRPTGSIAEELEKAYDERRRAQAQAVHGPRELIERRARVERELEKLAAEEE